MSEQQQQNEIKPGPAAKAPTQMSSEATSTTGAGNKPNGSSRGEAKDDPFPLTSIGRSLHVYRPAPSQNKASQAKKEAEGADGGSGPLSTALSPKTIVAPRVVLLLGWMDAPLRLLLKYAQPYSVLFPTATIVIKLSDGQTYLQGDKSQSLRNLVRLLAEDVEKGQARNAMRDEMGRVQQRAGSLHLDEDRKAAQSRDASASGVVEDEADPGDSTVTLVRRDEAIDESVGREAAASSSSSSPDLGLPPAPHGLLIHSFSDGGANNLAYLLRALRQGDDGRNIASQGSALVPYGSVLSPRAVIMDGSPSAGTAWSGATAFTIPLASPKRAWLVRTVLRNVARVSIFVYMRLLLLLRWIAGRKTRNQIFREELNDPRSWRFAAEAQAQAQQKQQTSSSSSSSSFSSSATLPPRLYLYSRADALVEYTAVEAHAKDAARRQACSSATEPYPVDMEQQQRSGEKKGDTRASSSERAPAIRLRRWTTAPHCGIGRADPDGYWSEVRDFLSHVM